MLLLNNDDVATVLDMPLCLAALDGVFQEMATGDAVGAGGVGPSALDVPCTQSPSPVMNRKRRRCVLKIISLSLLDGQLDWRRGRDSNPR